MIRFHALSQGDVATCLLERQLAENPEEAETMASWSEGSLSRAIQYSGETITEFRMALWTELSKPKIDRNGLSKLMTQFVESAGKENAAKRHQLRIALDLAVGFYRALGRQLCEEVAAGQDPELTKRVAESIANSSRDPEVVVTQAERCLDAVQQVNANANLSILIDAWACDLAVMNRTNRSLLSEPRI